MSQARKAGVGVYPASPYYLGAVPQAGLLLGYASLSEKEIEDGIRLLADVIIDS